MNIGEILKIAVVDTALGMGIVFIILILIAFCIYLLGEVVGKLDRAQASKKSQASVCTDIAKDAQANGLTSEEYGDDGLDPELAAVIAMVAIKTYMKEQGSDDEYIVRRVRRSTWTHSA